MSSAKPSKTFWCSRLRIFRLRGFQCYQSLGADFVSRSLSSRRFPVVGRRSVTEFITEQFTFWKTKFRSCHRAASNICRGAPKNYESSGFRRRSACPTSSRASVPPSVITPRTAALHARVEPVHDKTESAALIFGRSYFLPRELWGGQPPIRIRTRCVDSVFEAMGPWAATQGNRAKKFWTNGLSAESVAIH
jgi:hypothetical protein